MNFDSVPGNRVYHLPKSVSFNTKNGRESLRLIFANGFEDMKSKFLPGISNRPRLFESWIALSTGQIAIQRISITTTNCAIQWIVIYPVDSAIHLSNNWGQENSRMPFETFRSFQEFSTETSKTTRN